jgi:biopolymer transport protein ExbD
MWHMRRNRRILVKPRINMTPMIDVVFLLLTFFVMTFKIIVPEGDFNVQMSPTGQVRPVEMTDEPVQVRLTADAHGSLSAIQLNNEGIEDFDKLRQHVSVIGLAKSALGKPDWEIVIFPDEHLRYEYVIEAVTAVNGELLDGQHRKICNNIKFARQKK